MLARGDIDHVPHLQDLFDGLQFRADMVVIHVAPGPVDVFPGQVGNGAVLGIGIGCGLLASLLVTLRVDSKHDGRFQVAHHIQIRQAVLPYG